MLEYLIPSAAVGVSYKFFSIRGAAKLLKNGKYHNLRYIKAIKIEPYIIRSNNREYPAMKAYAANNHTVISEICDATIHASYMFTDKFPVHFVYNTQNQLVAIGNAAKPLELIVDVPFALLKAFGMLSAVCGIVSFAPSIMLFIKDAL